LACACMCWFVSRTGRESSCAGPVSRAEHESACLSAYGDSAMILHALASIEN
jgi:hypothetical protein